MCGIFAILKPDSRIRADAVDRAPSSLRHRGPDDRQIWRDEAADIGLGHARLSIQNLSEASVSRWPVPVAAS
jgi:asparagine synthase (glutamine-hydrolysing)